MPPEACPDCRGACEPWELDGKPCGFEPEPETCELAAPVKATRAERIEDRPWLDE